MSTCYTYFLIRGDFPTDAVTDALHLRPESAWEKTDLRPDGHPYGFSQWSGGYCRDYDPIVAVQMRATVAPFKEKVSVLRSLKERYDLTYTLEIVPTISKDDPLPALGASSDIIDFCSDVGADIDIDMYLTEA